MKSFLIKPAQGLEGEILLLGDKSIAHRSIIIAALACGKTKIQNFPTNEDCLASLESFKKLGIKIIRNSSSNTVNVFGKGLFGLKKPKGQICVGDSGTTLRLLLGVLAGQNFKVTLTCGRSLSQRPMLRVNAPLRLMGAEISSKLKAQNSKLEEYAPITIKGGSLEPITYRMPVASAQVKSAILLAGLYAKGVTRIIEPFRTRDHTERMLKLFGAELKLNQNTIVIKGVHKLISPGKIFIPGDLSSASFFIVAGTIVAHSKILIRKVSLNPSRMGIIRVLERMGADIKLKAQSSKLKNREPLGDLLVKSSSLKGTTVKRKEIPSLIDELPVLMVAASLARGKTIFEGVDELRVKETDRIRSMSGNLRKMGADIKDMTVAGSANIVIQGVKQLKGAKVESFGDHRSAMSVAIAGLRAAGQTRIDDVSCIKKSFPDFFIQLKSLIK